MPLLDSTFQPWPLFRSANVQTIAPALFRKVQVAYVRERIDTPDADFIDIDWLKNSGRKVALLIHGLEASSEAAYIKGMAAQLHHHGFSVAAMNLRGCSGIPNQTVYSYHSGATEDLATTVKHLASMSPEVLIPIGFSLGGNLLLKYLGEAASALHPSISCAMAISVPCDLKACALKLDSPAGMIYRIRFLKTLKRKALSKIRSFGFPLNEKKLRNVNSLVAYDNCFTAPLYGFADAMDYYERCSSKRFIGTISIPTLILTARDDPFFTTSCLPVEECRQHPHVFLESPDHGGHVGFMNGFPWGTYYAEERALRFLRDQKLIS